jgi:hypothetical protein
MTTPPKFQKITNLEIVEANRGSAKSVKFHPPWNLIILTMFHPPRCALNDDVPECMDAWDDDHTFSPWQFLLLLEGQVEESQQDTKRI